MDVVTEVAAVRLGWLEWLALSGDTGAPGVGKGSGAPGVAAAVGVTSAWNDWSAWCGWRAWSGR
eukprot:6495772-Pyramimonas_sp.AAC.1